MESAYVRITLLSETGDELLDVAATAIPVFDAAGDHRSLGRALLLAGWVEGGRRGHHQLRLTAAERALGHYRRSTWPLSTPVGEIANALYFGPASAPEAIERCETLIRDEDLDRYGRANVEVYLGGLVAYTGDFDHARSLIAAAGAAYDELGQRASAATFSGAILGEVELLVGDAVAAEAIFRWLCNDLQQAQAFSHLASRAGDLAETLYVLGRLDEAAQWAGVAERHSALDDVDALVLWMPVRAKIIARAGPLEQAVALAHEAVQLAETSDALNRHAKAQRDLGEVLSLAGRAAAARTAYGAALELYEAKGNVVEAGRMRSMLNDVALV
jgi:tetratricopeptide (TPR) repeat protein